MVERDATRFSELTERIIGCAFQVSSELGTGFLEKVYENALAHELRKASFTFAQQARLAVRYDGVVVGDYIADLVVEEQILLEIKSVEKLHNAHVAQALNYLRATGLPLCLLLNFATPKLEIRRVIL